MNTRRVEKKIDGEWKTVEMKELKPGDIFRVFEYDGTPIEYPFDSSNGREFVANSKPKKDGESWRISASRKKEIRYKGGFLFFPKKINGKWHWLSTRMWEEKKRLVWSSMGPEGPIVKLHRWKPTDWIDVGY